MTFKRSDIRFASKGTQCGGWLYLPENTHPPIVIMAHGFAAERTFRLPAFAEYFARRGMAVLLFDYRNFGMSDGEPRNLVDPLRHREDWNAAIAMAHTLDSVDRKKIALWGTSFSGGHVLAAASANPDIRAVIAQVPFVDGLATARLMGLRFILRAASHSLRDLWRKVSYNEPHYVKVVSHPHDFAVMNTPDSHDGYMALVPDDSTWQNRCPARVLLSASFYRPIRYAPTIQCPVMIVLAKQDSLIPATAVRNTAARIKQSTLLELKIGHFDVYSGDVFRQVAEAETEFLEKHLLQ